MTSTRQKWLLVVLALVVGGYFVSLGVDRFYTQPLAAERQLKANLEKRLRDSRTKLKKLDHRLAMRDELEKRSLPSNVELASSIYQAWLLNLVTKLGLTTPTVDSTTPIAEEGITRLQFNVRGNANLRQFTQLLFEFFRAGHLHKIQQISLTPVGSSDRLDIQIGIEALALQRSHNESELSSLPSGNLLFGSAEEYFGIAKRNLFGEGIMSLAVRTTRLTAITSDRFGVREAWMHVEQDNTTYFMHQGDSLELESVALELKEIETDYVVLDLEGQVGRLAVGKTLAELEPAN